MHSTARRLSVICFILSCISILGLIMLTLCFIYWGLAFEHIFTLMMYLIAMTVISLCLTISLRSLLQELEFDYDSNALQVKKLSDRISELERRVK